MKTYLLFTLFYVVCLFPLQAQHIKFKNLTTENGLPSNASYCVYEDKKGFIWIGTDAGLVRYDGKQMLIFAHEPNNPNSLADNVVYNLTEDANGIFWVMTATTLHQYNPYTQQWKRLIKKKFEVREESWLKDQAGNVWWRDRQDSVSIVYACYRAKTDTIVKYECRWDKKMEFSRLLLEYEGAVYGVGGFFRFETAQDQFVKVHQSNGFPIHDMGFHAHAQQGNGKLHYWYGVGFHLVYDLKTQQTIEVHDDATAQTFEDTPFWQTNSTINYALFDNQTNKAYVATYRGLVEINIAQQKHYRYQPNAFDAFALKNRAVTRLFKDSKGNIWVATEGGVSYFPARPLFEHQYAKILPRQNPLSSNHVQTFDQDADGKLWIGTKEKINVWNRNLNTYDTFSLNVPHKEIYAHTLNAKHDIRGIALLNPTEAYVATWGNSLHRLNIQTKKSDIPLAYNTFSAYNQETISLCGLGFVSNLKTDTQGDAWATEWGCGLGLIHYDTRTRTANSYDVYKDTTYLKIPASEAYGGELMTLTLSPQKIWVGNSKGLLYEFDKASKHFTKQMRYREHDTTSMLGTVINHLFFSHQTQKLWVGTASGLNRMEDDGTFKRFNHFPNNYIAGIAEDKRGWLWVSTQNGVVHFNPQNGYYKHYSEHDGLQTTFNENAVFTSPTTNEIFFGGAHGFNFFHPDSVAARQNTAEPQTVLTAIKVMNQPYISQDTALAYKKQIDLFHTQNDLQFSFAALDLTAPSKNQYRYRLLLLDNGFFNLGNNSDTTWKDLGNNNTLNLTRLRFGRYRLEISGSNNNGVFATDNNIAILYINLSVPWYFRISTLVLFLLALLLMVVLIVWLRQRNLQARNRELEQKVQQRTAQLAKQNEEIKTQAEEIKIQAEEIERLRGADQHGLSNELLMLNIILQGNYDALTHNPEAQEIINKVKGFVKMLEKLHRESYETKGNIDVEVSLKKMRDDLIFMFPRTITWNFDEVRNIGVLPNKQTNNLMFIFQEFAFNASKYAFKSQNNPIITLTLYQEQSTNRIVFVCTDNGAGFPPEKIGNGDARFLKVIHQLSRNLNADIKAYNRQEGGACLELNFERK